jgi:hypothetical protein
VPIQDRITQIALAKQTSQASLAASGVYQIGINSGGLATLDISEDALPTSWSSRIVEHHDRGAVTPKVGFETVAMPRSIGLLLAAVIGNESAATSGSNKSHVFTPGTGALPYLTAFTRRDAEYFKLGDVRIDEVELSWEGTKALTVKVSAMGCQYEFLATSYPVVTGGDERPQTGVLKGAGGQFVVNGTSAVVKGGNVKITNNLDTVHGSASALPSDIFPGMLTVAISLTIVPQDLTLFRTVVTGSSGGTTVQTVPEYGSVYTSWQVDANASLSFDAPRVKFMTDFPEAKAEGGAVEISLEGEVANDTSVAAFTITLINSVTGAY